MKKAKEDLIENIDALFKCLNKYPELKLLSDQREKLNILERFINDEVIAREELSTIKPLWHKSIRDPQNISHHIDAIAFLFRDNYNEIKLSSAEKMKPKNLIKLVSERVLTDEESAKIFLEIQEIPLAKINRLSELKEEFKAEMTTWLNSLFTGKPHIPDYHLQLSHDYQHKGLSQKDAEKVVNEYIDAAKKNMGALYKVSELLKLWEINKPSNSEIEKIELLREDDDVQKKFQQIVDGNIGKEDKEIGMIVYLMSNNTMSNQVKKILLFIIIAILPILTFGQRQFDYYIEGNIKSAFYNQRFSEGVRDYETATRKNSALDSESKSLALYCFVNKDDVYVLPSGAKKIGAKLDSSINIFLNLSEELIKKEPKFTCLRMRIYQKIINCYRYANDSLYNYFNPLYKADEKFCNDCCIINKYIETPGSRRGITDIKYINTKLSKTNFKPNYRNNDSLKILGAVPNYNIDSFINESAVWGNGIDTGIIARQEIDITVKKDGTVSYGSIYGTAMLETNQKIINSKYSNASASADKLSEIFAQMPKWKTTMTSNSVIGTYVLTVWAR